MHQIARSASHGFEGVSRLGRGLEAVPTAWPARALAALAGGDVPAAASWFALAVVLAAALLAIAWLSYQRALVIGVGVFGEGGGQAGRRQAVRQSLKRRRAAEAPPSPIRAIVHKDLVTLRRDVRRLSSILPGIAVAVAYPFVFHSPITGVGGELGFWLGMAGSAFIPFMMSMLFALPAIGLEGRGMQLLHLAAIPARTVIRAKLASVVPLVMGPALLGGIGTALFHAWDPGRLLAVVATFAWLSAGMAVIGVCAGAIAPNFAATDPRRAVRFEGGLASIAGELCFGGASLCALALILLARHQLAGAALPLTLVAAVLAVGAAAVVAFMAFAGERAVAAYRFDRD
jgi:hypothetical protein